MSAITTEMSAEMLALKTRLKSTWEAGDYAHFARPIESGALEFLARLNVVPGTRVLDVACGAGQIAIPMAYAGAEVVGVDIASNQIAHARARAQSAGVHVQFDEGDAEDLPYEDAEFDLVVSLIGAMFAPRPERVAAELLRVCRPGGRIVMANWTADGVVGHVFKIIAKHVPPPSNMPSPVLWGNEAVVRERLGWGTTEMICTKRYYPFHYELSVPAVIDFYRSYYGPLNRAFAALNADGQQRLRTDLQKHLCDHNTATDGSTQYVGEYLEVVAVRA
jgi:ubiquinone/menaquinone biosynthesis C-methylase UbiE